MQVCFSLDSREAVALVSRAMRYKHLRPLILYEKGGDAVSCRRGQSSCLGLLGPYQLPSCTTPCLGCTASSAENTYSSIALLRETSWVCLACTLGNRSTHGSGCGRVASPADGHSAAIPGALTASKLIKKYLCPSHRCLVCLLRSLCCLRDQ